MRAEVESFTMRIEKDDFDQMMSDYPKLKSELIADATFRQEVKKVEAETVNQA